MKLWIVVLLLALATAEVAQEATKEQDEDQIFDAQRWFSAPCEKLGACRVMSRLTARFQDKRDRLYGRLRAVLNGVRKLKQIIRRAAHYKVEFIRRRLGTAARLASVLGASDLHTKLLTAYKEKILNISGSRYFEKRFKCLNKLLRMAHKLRVKILKLRVKLRRVLMEYWERRISKWSSKEYQDKFRERFSTPEPEDPQERLRKVMDVLDVFRGQMSAHPFRSSIPLRMRRRLNGRIANARRSQMAAANAVRRLELQSHQF